MGGRDARAMGRARCHRRRPRVRGRKAFQMRCMSWSYRNRGREARIQRKSTARITSLIIILAEALMGAVGVWEVPRNRAAVRAFIKRMLAYSARKNRAKGPPAYSTLNPDTSSDSPSARSNGDRFVSARVETNHMAARGQAGKTSQIFSWAVAKT